MNKTVMLEIADLIEQSNPKNFHMGSWFGQLLTVEEIEDLGMMNDYIEESGLGLNDVVNMPISHQLIYGQNVLDKDFQNQLACNTTACIAGWTVFNEFIKNGTPIDSSVERRATQLLGLTTEQANSLFFCGYGTIWDTVADKYEFDYDRDEPATWNFPNIMVASVLRKIVDGEFDLEMNHNFEEEYEDTH